MNCIQGLKDHLLSKEASLHNDKESKAYIGFAIQIGIFSGIITSEQWLPCWFKGLNTIWQTIAIISLVILYFLLHIFIRWQLRQRRFSAIRYAAILRWKMGSEVDESKIKEDIEKNRWFNIFDYILPLKIYYKMLDLEKEAYPEEYIKYYKVQSSKGSKAIRNEWLLFVAWCIMTLLVSVRTFCC